MSRYIQEIVKSKTEAGGGWRVANSYDSQLLLFRSSEGAPHAVTYATLFLWQIMVQQRFLHSHSVLFTRHSWKDCLAKIWSTSYSIDSQQLFDILLNNNDKHFIFLNKLQLLAYFIDQKTDKFRIRNIL